MFTPFTAKLIGGGLAAVLTSMLPASEAAAQQSASAPNFSSSAFGWLTFNGEFLPVPGGVIPMRNDPAYPFVPNNTGRQPTYRIADLTNPNLKPWVKLRMKKDNDEVIAGKIAFTPLELPAGGRSGFHLVRFPADLFRANAQRGLDNLLGGPAGATRLSRRTAFG
jgi:hypothetical protein